MTYEFVNFNENFLPWYDDMAKKGSDHISIDALQSEIVEQWQNCGCGSYELRSSFSKKYARCGNCYCQYCNVITN